MRIARRPVVLLGLAAASATAEVARVGTLPAPVNESSGLVASMAFPGEFWTHNDSGGAAEIFRVTAAGELTARVVLEGAANRDWESIANDGQRLWIGDVGDNSRVRETILLYGVAEDGGQLERLELRYPDAPHDCEALFVSGGDAYLITKTLPGVACGVYVARQPKPGETTTLEKLTELRLSDLITGADISRDGRRIALVGYFGVHVFLGDGTPEEILATPPRRVAWPFREQVEAVAFDGLDLLVTSEQRGFYRLPAADYEAATPPA